MRRPLFWVALFLVCITAVRLKMGILDVLLPDAVRLRSLDACEKLTVTGQVYKKDDQTIYLQDISVRFDISDHKSSEILSQADISWQNISCEDNLICKLPDVYDIPLGSYVTLVGSFAPFSPATNPGEFDAFTYYRSIGVGGRLSRVEIIDISHEHWPIREFLHSLRLGLEERLFHSLPESHAGILSAFLLGDKGGLDEQVEELYRQNGILHILSISGLHVTFFGMSLYRLLRRLRVPVAAAAAAGSILLVLYGGLTGFGVSTCRAIGMYLIRMLGEALGRTYDMLTALGVMAAVMVAVNPHYLEHSGFLLSYSAVLGISVFCPALFGEPQNASGAETGFKQRFGQWAAGHGWRERLLRSAGQLGRGLEQSAAASLSVTLATLPVQLWSYYEVPVYAVFLNLLVLPLMEPLMLLGLIVLLLPGFLPAGFGVSMILDFYEFLCECFGRLPFHTWNPGCPKVWQIGVYYLLLTAVAILKSKLSDRKKKADGKLWGVFPSERSHKLYAALPWMGVVCAVLMLGVRFSVENQAVFLDVGQGDCILIRTASGENYLFDCGSSSRSGAGEYVLMPYLKYYGIHRLDAVIVSHPDKDHMSGILELLEMGEEKGVEICQLVLPEIAEELREEQLGQLMTSAYADGQKEPVEIRWLAAGDGWQVGSASFLCLHPESGSMLTDPNAYSMCVYVEFRESGEKHEQPRSVAALLLTGDVEGEGEESLLGMLRKCGIGQADVLKVAHHGSKGTTSRELLQQINPLLSVISSGRNNSYGHPHEELLMRLEEAGSEIIGTAEWGAVTLYFRDGKIQVETFLHP